LEKTAHHDPAGRRGEVLGGAVRGDQEEAVRHLYNSSGGERASGGSEGRSEGGGQALVQFRWRREGFWGAVRGDQKEVVRHLYWN